ncbi:DNA-directed RNA polymerase subunit alpha [Candidatus Falkowbacteria bacterium RIFOXYB2_FULL_34_18]|uniref:DNA-directed RNA polymerase subunit alpha n=1 Tax=Candidatus Falkowbacteria bacterium RIFOXYD2_FULL_34_120 TaxID=1798007 RepID=A0A1F5TMV0_9BACT|nr:MAG: DNA-directed RNA polymerase subunit alpha [Candidatus Falkowbacteria bacterium RIFOXYC12_FULL_34_55]OGF28696.1 MAG: DNA-directed RNA polymerase subunit alpha [Candidatus Falkowbacteria bacterium RIFOXYB2_FULL_34_18]OGF38061.1 MAG: DNA-directed RNA polymerase subunit alpha [Candidatus Falkowbacteria bacterium RIFOXYC2_FULL_34_220]OGF38315.1 MAG: DNA-directed RNA polymerase subunit alpha [Candidatus Falkowbacteria bacterium RIFOXYD12_FULL_34_57]OGF40302.1 MAG: DNA-directed RNA polymerase 
MQNIALPKTIKYQKGAEENQGNMIIEPCFPGYGITLGNSLRRVLLSSLSGAAPIGVKIKGINHEFMSLPHLKEDILEFVLNLKELKLKVFSDEVVKLELNIHGKKEIKASDITKNSLVEIVNPDFVLGHITDMAGSLNAEIYVSRGMGYEILESREKKDKELGYIDMDSIFSPVISVGVEVENVRVGKMTNWDRLILNIKTDGTITPEEAFYGSANILIEQFTALVPEKKEEKKEKKEKKEKNKK